MSVSNLVLSLLLSTSLSQTRDLAEINSTPYTWRNVEIVGGGFVSGIITHPRAKDVVYARTDIGGVYRLDPATRRWIPIEDWITRPDWNLYGAESVAIDPSDPQRVYIAAGTYTNEWGQNGAILRSRDQGRTWQRTDLPFKNGGNEDGRSIGERLAVDPAAGRVIYFGTRHEGLWRSSDQGVTWARDENFPIKGRTNRIGIGWVVFDPAPRRGRGPTVDIYVGPAIKGQPIIVSHDAGKSWKPIEGGPQNLIPHHAAFDQSGDLVITYGDGPGPNGVTDGAVWKYSPRGSKWIDITPIPPSTTDRFGYAGLSIDRNYSGTYIVSTLDRWGRDTIFRTKDYGKTWMSIADKAVRDSTGAPFLKWNRKDADFGHWIGDVEIDPYNSNRAWYVTGATIWGTDDLRNADTNSPTHWKVRVQGLEECAVLDLISPPKGANVISAVGDIGGFVHNKLFGDPDAGMWTHPLMNNVDDLDFAEDDPQTLIRIGRGNEAHGAISRDQGKTWAPFVGAPTNNATSGSGAISANGRTIVWSLRGPNVFLTADEGSTWLQSETNGASGRIISDRVDSRAFYLFNEATGDFAVSVDSAKTFRTTAHLPAKSGRPIAVFGKRGHVWVPTPAGLQFSDDGGEHFRVVSPDLSAEQVGVGRAISGGYPTLYVIGNHRGRRPGVFRSVDMGRTWVQINDEQSGFGTMSVITGDPKVFGRVYLGTNGRGVIVADPKRS